MLPLDTMHGNEPELEPADVEVDGRRVEYRVTGSGEPLVLVHGLAGSWRWWSPLVAALAPHRRVHVVDLPRRHAVVRPDELSGWLRRWLDAVGLDEVELAGHSLGGLVAAELAATDPERTRKLVLVAPAGIPCGRSLPERGLGLLGALYDVRSSLPLVVGDALRTGPLSLVRSIGFVSSRDLRDELAGVRVPTLLVWGDKDDLVPFRIAADWQRTLPDSRLARLACGHVPMLEAPAEAAEVILAFLDEELPDDRRDEVGAGVLDGVGLAGDEDEPAVR
jgi:pimeloyl-ACP methyl ester carboxylesterase